MNKSIVLIIGLLLVGMVSAVNELTVNNIYARESGSNVRVDFWISNTLPHEIKSAITAAYCTHNNTQYLIATEVDSIFESRNFITLNGYTNCTIGDPVWVRVGEYISPSTNITTYGRAHINTNTAPNEVPEFGVFGGIMALIGVIGILIYTRRD